GSERTPPSRPRIGLENKPTMPSGLPWPRYSVTLRGNEQRTGLRTSSPRSDPAHHLSGTRVASGAFGPLHHTSHRNLSANGQLQVSCSLSRCGHRRPTPVNHRLLGQLWPSLGLCLPEVGQDLHGRDATDLRAG